MRPSERHLVIFARAPRIGTVKRRLARDLGPVAAWRFHRFTTGALIRRLAADTRWRTWLAVTPDRWAARSGGLWPGPAQARAELIPQGGGDLGTRMSRAFESLPPGFVVIVGSDIPDIRPHHVAAAFRALGRADAAIGPADDGGYWLIGLRRRPLTRHVPRPPFSGVRWGGPHALEDTLANLRGGRVEVLDILADIDTAADLKAWRG